VSIGIFSDVFVTDLGTPLPRGTRIRIVDAERLVAETDTGPEHGATADVRIGGRIWTITVAHPDRGTAVNALAILGVGLLVAGVTHTAFRRSIRQAAKLEAAHFELATMVSNLQRGLLRDTVDMAEEGVTAVVRYVPAAEHARLGGDWYDIFRATDGALVLTIGDVAGHGVEAVVQMQRIRQSVSAYAYEGRSPSEVLRLTEGSLQTVRPGSEMATVWIGRLDTGTGRLVHASAGHPPAIVSCPGETPRQLQVAGGPPLNTGIRSPRWEEHVDELSEGCVLALYTDGVFEARGITIDEGLDRVGRCLEDPSRSLDDIAEAMLVGRPDPGSDDAALVVVRWDQSKTPAPAGVSERAGES
jgi:serine phosphatase RsbU (regulator of sigma subunit)